MLVQSLASLVSSWHLEMLDGPPQSPPREPVAPAEAPQKKKSRAEAFSARDRALDDVLGLVGDLQHG